MTTTCPSFVYRDSTTLGTSAGPATDVVPLPTNSAGDLLILMAFGDVLSFSGLAPFWNVWQAGASFSGDIIAVTRICDGSEPASVSFAITDPGPLERVYLAMSCTVTNTLYPYTQDTHAPPFPVSGWDVGTTVSAGVVAPGDHTLSGHSSDEMIPADNACSAASLVSGLFARGGDMVRGTPTGFDDVVSVSDNGVIFGTMGILTRFAATDEFGQVTDTLNSGSMDQLTQSVNVWCVEDCPEGRARDDYVPYPDAKKPAVRYGYELR